MNLNPVYNEEDKQSHRGVAAIIKNDKGEILMQEHVKFGFWTIPCGKVLPDQSVRDGLAQEMLEETGITVKDVWLLGSTDKEYLREGKPVRVEINLFDIIEYEGLPQNLEPHKHKQQIFLSISDIEKLENISDSTRLMLRLQDQIDF